MCGIAGMVRLTDTPIEAAQLKTLLIGLQPRGGDATGIATVRGERIAVYKNDTIAWKFCASKQTDNFLDANLDPTTDMVLLHTRAVSRGSAWKNENNHPLYAGKSAVVHNGTLHNDDELFRDMKLERKAETDTDLLRAILDKHGATREAIRQLKRIRGSCAIAAVSPDNPGQLILGRAGSPLVLAYTDDFFIWSSTKEPIYRAMRTWKEWHGMFFQAARVDLKFSPMLREQIYLIDIERLRNDPNYEPWEEDFDVCKNYTPPCYRVHERYPEKQAAKERELKEAKEAEEREQRERERKAREQQRAAIERKPSDQQNVPGTALVEEKPKLKGKLLVLNPRKEARAIEGQTFMCSNPKCKQIISIGKGAGGKFVYELECPTCKKLLADPDDVDDTSFAHRSVN